MMPCTRALRIYRCSDEYEPEITNEFLSSFLSPSRSNVVMLLLSQFFLFSFHSSSSSSTFVNASPCRQQWDLLAFCLYWTRGERLQAAHFGSGCGGGVTTFLMFWRPNLHSGCAPS